MNKGIEKKRGEKKEGKKVRNIIFKRVMQINPFSDLCRASLGLLKNKGSVMNPPTPCFSSLSHFKAVLMKM